MPYEPLEVEALIVQTLGQKYNEVRLDIDGNIILGFDNVPEHQHRIIIQKDLTGRPAIYKGDAN